MLLWIAFALLTAAVLAWVLAPLGRPARFEEGETEAEVGTRAVYRDQLAEVEAERTAGQIGAAEAEAAKAEIARRLIASAAAPGRGASARRRDRVSHGGVALAAVLGVPLLTLGLYLAYGSPGMSSTELSGAAREQAMLGDMIARVERRLREVPGDGKGWEVIAPVYLKLGRFADAAIAYGNAVRLEGESVKLLAGLAEAEMLANRGIVTERARAAYQRLLELEPGRLEPRFWLAMAKEQDGRLKEALADYAALQKEAPPQAPYRGVLDTRIKTVSARMAAPAAAASRGPTAADVEAAARMSPGERERMIAGMVDGLAQRLKQNGNDLAGWQRLVRAYAVLGRHDEARAALVEARRNFEGNGTALADLSHLAEKLGLGS